MLVATDADLPNLLVADRTVPQHCAAKCISSKDDDGCTVARESPIGNQWVGLHQLQPAFCKLTDSIEAGFQHCSGRKVRNWLPSARKIVQVRQIDTVP